MCLRAWRGTRAAVLIRPAKPVRESLRVFPAARWVVATEAQNASVDSAGLWRVIRGRERRRGELTAPRQIFWCSARTGDVLSPLSLARARQKAPYLPYNPSFLGSSSSLMQPISVTTVTIGLLGELQPARHEFARPAAQLGRQSARDKFRLVGNFSRLCPFFEVVALVALSCFAGTEAGRNWVWMKEQAHGSPVAARWQSVSGCSTGLEHR